MYFFQTLFGWTNASSVSILLLWLICQIDAVFILFSYVCSLTYLSPCPVCFGFLYWFFLSMKLIYLSKKKKNPCNLTPSCFDSWFTKIKSVQSFEESNLMSYSKVSCFAHFKLVHTTRLCGISKSLK